MSSFQYILKSKLCFTRSFQFCVSDETELVEYENITNRREEGRGGGGGTGEGCYAESARILFCPGVMCELSLLLVLALLRAFFSEFFGFPPSTKPTYLISIEDLHENQSRLTWFPL